VGVTEAFSYYTYPVWKSIGRPVATRSPARTSAAYEHPVAWVELGDDPVRYLVAGVDRSGNLLELVVMAVQDDEFVIQALALRSRTRRELFGDDR